LRIKAFRLDITYHAWRFLFDDKLVFAPIGDTPHKVIDIGTGTGKWEYTNIEIMPLMRVLDRNMGYGLWQAINFLKAKRKC
jgi:ubiquinone/menaquinone biosynthesis C-methylase UbiE